MSQSQLFQGQVHTVRKITPTVYELTLKTEPKLVFQAGQFTQLVIQSEPPNEEARFTYYSIASSPSEAFLTLCIKQSQHTEKAEQQAQLQTGQTVWLKAPAGKLLDASAPNRKLCMIGTGTGLAPLRSILRHRLSEQSPTPKQFTFLLGAKNESELLFREEFESEESINFIPALSKADESWQGFRGYVTDYIKANPQLLAWAEFDFYICGQSELLPKAKEILKGYGVAEENIHHEKW